ncbi:MAG: GDSL-type esterase/lipase family protein, partial [Kiritimatiellae bacterium]|nr:GDSL-type esterase/lipase family protein [Kiritimatiellia bacterium]
LEKDVIGKQPAWMALSCGVNDVAHGAAGIPLDKYRENVTQIEDRTQKAGIRVMIMTATMIFEDRENESNKKLAGYNDFLRQLAKDKGCLLADLNADMQAIVKATRPLKAGPILTVDGVHMNPSGNVMMAKGVLKAFGLNALQIETAHDAWGTKMLAAEEGAGDRIRFPGPKTDYHGFDRHDFTVEGRKAIVVVPKKELPGRPWIWRAEFFYSFPGVDLALLEKGFHLGFISVGNTYGSPDALAHWDVFYREMTQKYRLSKKPALEGLSRGGLYIYNWAAGNPDKVGCLYGDAPVCDIKSWPGGKGKGLGSTSDWEALLKYYRFASEQESLDYKSNPIDNLAPLAAAGIPIIHVYGDADEVVPWQENTLIVKERYVKLGGHITLIPKPGVGHHPHGLPDPMPIVDFIVEKAGR